MVFGDQSLVLRGPLLMSAPAVAVAPRADRKGALFHVFTILMYVVVLSCSEMNAARSTQQALESHFATEKISVHVTAGDRATIIFVNSPLFGVSCEEQAETALEAVGVVRASYPNVQSLASIEVGFERLRSVGPVSGSQRTVPFSFRVRSLEADSGRADARRGIAQCREQRGLEPARSR